MRYFRVTFNPEINDGWFLGSPRDPGSGPPDLQIAANRERFTSCSRYSGAIRKFTLPVEVPGRPLPFSFGAFDIPVVTSRLGSLIADYAVGDVQLVPAMISNEPEMYILNVLTCINCIDETLTSGTKWTTSDNRPDKIGRYRMIKELRIDASMINNSHVFRIDTWRIALIVSESLVRHCALQDLNCIRLTPV